MKQDRSGVRTAQDLERKYDFAGIKKAVKVQEEGINQTNKKLETFINSTLKNDTNIQVQTDGQITTWFAHGEPTLANEPTVYWVTDEQKGEHIGDLYYDRDTGYAYEFIFTDDIYKWGIVEDDAVIESLAIANSEYDTKDNKRRVFTEVPYPPYENGDLWFDGSDIYVCQISKAALNMETGEAEAYVEGDFIIATKYTDDTVANQVGEELKVLQGTVLTVIEGADQFKAEVYDLDDKTKASINLIEQSLSTLVKGVNGESLMTQTENGWEFSIESLLTTVGKAVADVETLQGDTASTINDLNNVKDVLDAVSKVTSYMRLTEVDGEPHLELGTNINGFKSVYTNKGVDFMVGDTVQASIDYNELNTERAVIREELQLGGFVISERANGNVGFLWKGDE